MGFPFLGLFLLILLGGGFYLLLRKSGGDRGPAVDRIQQKPLGSSGHSAPRRAPKAEVFRLAKRHGGVLTVSDVVTELDIDPEDAEQLLDGLADGHRVVMNVDNDGVVTYTFSELTR